MGVHLDQRQGTVFRGMRAQERQRDGMIAAQRETGRTRVEDGRRMGGDASGHVGGVRIVEGHVAVIEDGEFLQRRHAVPAEGRIDRLQRRGLADRARTQPRAGAVRHRLVEGDAGHRDIDARQVLAVAAAQETGRAGKDVLETQPLQIGPGEGVIDLVLRVFQRHGRAPFCPFSRLPLDEAKRKPPSHPPCP
jgi:hypothetical protein